MERRGRAFSKEQIQVIQKKIEVWKETDEMALLVFVFMNTNLKLQDVLTWFNNNVAKRLLYVNEKKWTGDFWYARNLFPKTHQAYLNQWRRVCKKWFGIQAATFEMLKRTPISI